jgi:Protein of unknown function (DUF1553)/Protein of unknown function (DUF1549)/Planctomycete cytochrome C
MVVRLSVFTVLCIIVAIESVAADFEFSRDVKPLLAEHCIKCHGPDKAEGGLDLSRRESAIKRGDSGEFPIVPGKVDASHLIARVSSGDPDVRMPPGDEKPLHESEIAILTKWIEAGAEYQTHWSFRPLESPAVPTVSDPKWIKNPIDSFVLAKLDAKSVKPSPEARPSQLIRRLYLDLIGLLPSPEQVESFEKAYRGREGSSSNADEAYSKLVDELLASKHFGERWGRHWLDLARYADSDGYEKDRPRPDAYVYRDWVIHAFNSNMPFDRFTIEQLAGDLLPNATPIQRIATAFNRQTLTNTEGGTDQEEFRVAATFDRTDTLGSVWLGLTVGCAKCHTHKYDPIPHTDYYRLFAFFNEADEFVEKIPTGPEEKPDYLAELLPLEKALHEHYQAIYPDEQRWEAEQRKLVEKGLNTPLKVEEGEISVTATSKSGLAFSKQKEGALLVSSESESDKKLPATDIYAIVIEGLPEDFSGFRIESVPDTEVEKSRAGLAKNGNFVISRISAEIIDSEGKKVRELPLQNAEASFEQTGFKAADALAKKTNSKKGWAISPRLTQAHWWQARTNAAIKLKSHERVRLTIEQAFGDQHLLGRFRIRVLTGDTRDLHLTKEIINALKMYPEKRINDTRDTLFDFYAKQDPVVQDLLAKIEAVHKKAQSQVMPVRMLATSRKNRSTFRFDRGDFLAPAEQVQPGTLQVLPPLTAIGEKPSRLDLARWLVGKENALTPRVVANQFWMRLFGAGIVRSVGDFGVRGEVPSHPELLDWLAKTYRDDLQWNTKEYIKTIVMSNTYRQSSSHRPEMMDRDPLNQWLSRQNRLRVEAELVRDLALQVSGLLSPKVGGPSVFPPMPPELAKLSYANNFSWTDSKGEDRYRRGMYTFFKRTIPHPTLMTFDCPDANLTCVNRGVSNTPLQALALLNNESFLEASQALARRLLTSSIGNEVANIAQAIRICLTREPQEEELERLESLLDHARDFYRDHPEEVEAFVGDYTVPGVPKAEVASWIATVRVLINLDEFITRE